MPDCVCLQTTRQEVQELVAPDVLALLPKSFPLRSDPSALGAESIMVGPGGVMVGAHVANPDDPDTPGRVSEPYLRSSRGRFKSRRASRPSESGSKRSPLDDDDDEDAYDEEADYEAGVSSAAASAAPPVFDESPTDPKRARTAIGAPVPDVVLPVAAPEPEPAPPVSTEVGDAIRQAHGIPDITTRIGSAIAAAAAPPRGLCAPVFAVVVACSHSRMPFRFR